MLNIGRLNILATIQVPTITVDAYGQQVKSMASGDSIWVRKVVNKTNKDIESNAVLGTKDIHLICRYNTSIKLNYEIKLNERNGYGGTDVTYTITGIEELGRGEGLKLYCTRNISNNSR